MTDLNLNTPIGSWVAEQPTSARIFEEVHLDYCCGGQISLEEACWRNGLDAKAIFLQLKKSAILPTEIKEEVNWRNASLTELCDNIESTHHAFLRQELPRLATLVHKVVEAHGETHKELHEVRAVFISLREELEPHLFKEEHVLFPAIRKMESTKRKPRCPFGSLANPISVMEQEHESAGSALHQLCHLTANYQPPADGCPSYQTLLEGLRELEKDLHLHIHKENNILFPRARKMEESVPD